MSNIGEFNSKVIDSKVIDDIINLISGVEDDNNLQIEVPIKAFNLFLSSNSDYLYNKTYILDLLNTFNKNLNSLKKAQSIAEDLLDKLKSINGKWFVLVDDYFIITSCYIKEVITYNRLKSRKISFNQEEKELAFVDRNIYKFINCNNLFNINEKKHTARLILSSDFNVLFTLSSKDDIKQLEKKIQFFVQKNNQNELREDTD